MLSSFLRPYTILCPTCESPVTMHLCPKFYVSTVISLLHSIFVLPPPFQAGTPIHTIAHVQAIDLDYLSN